MEKRTANFPDVKVTNFTTSLADGRALLAVLNDYDPSESPYEPSDNPADNLRRWGPEATACSKLRLHTTIEQSCTVLLGGGGGVSVSGRKNEQTSRLDVRAYVLLLEATGAACSRPTGGVVVAMSI